jgi:seryl-tRNA synthetase
LMRDEAMRGTGYYPGSEEQTYRMERDELNLAGTAEVPLTAFRMGEILEEKELPIKFAGMSTCFRVLDARRAPQAKTPTAFTGFTSSTRSSRL